MSRTQGYWYLRRYSDLRKKYGARNWRAAQKHWREFGIKERRNKLAYRDLNEWESKEYLGRFRDVTWSTKTKMTETQYANKHYMEWGIYEGRNRHRTYRITNIQAKCYLNRYVDLAQRYKRNYNGARNHWYRKGYRMKRNPKCDNTKTQKNIAQGPRHVAHHYAKFRCVGDAWFTRLSADQNSIYKTPKPKADSFIEVSHFGMRRKRAPNRWIKCQGRFWGKDVAPHMRKQCFCEAKPRSEPRRCAKEGQWCRRCNGVVFYGVYKKNGKVQDLEGLMSKNYRYKEKYNNSNLRCVSKTFGGDPNRGIYKQCFCDDAKFVNMKKIKADFEYNRQQELIRRNKRRLRLMAVQRRRRLQQEKERRMRLLKQRAEAERKRKLREEEIARARQ